MSNEQLIGDAELGLGAAEAPGERPQVAAVSRRPASLLERSRVERLSQRTDAHALVGEQVVVERRGYLAGQWQIIRMLLESGPAARAQGKSRSPLL